MTKFNNYRMTPGNKANLRSFLNKLYIQHYYNNSINEFIISNDNGTATNCLCVKEQSNINNQGFINNTITNTSRISNILKSSLGGKINYGDFNNTPVKINYLGGWEGQPGGNQAPLRNKF